MIASIIFTSEKSTAGLVVGENETLNSCSELVLFDLDKSNIRPEFNNTFVSVLEKVILSKDFIIYLDGHTDIRAGHEYNMRLSNRRVQSVKNELIQLGVPEDKIQYDYFGKTKLLTKATTEDKHELNRRVVIQIDTLEEDENLKQSKRKIGPADMVLSNPLFSKGNDYTKFPRDPVDPSPSMEQPDNWEYGGTLFTNTAHSSIYYSPGVHHNSVSNPYSEDPVRKSRNSADVGGTFWIGKNGVRIAEADTKVGFAENRSFGGGGVTVHLNGVDVGKDQNLYLRAEGDNTVAFGNINPIEVGFRTRPTVENPLSIQTGVIPISYFYESRGFEGELGSGMQLWGTGLRIGAAYTPLTDPGFKVALDTEVLLGWDGKRRQHMFGPDGTIYPNTAAEDNLINRDSISPFIKSELEVSVPIYGPSLTFNASAQVNWMKYTPVSNRSRQILESVGRVGITYTP